MIATGEDGAKIGEAVRIIDGTEGKLGAEGDTLAEAWPKGVTRQERGGEVGGAKFGAGGQRRKRLGGESRREVEIVGFQDVEVVVGRFIRPLEAEGDGKSRHGWQAQNGG